MHTDPVFKTPSVLHETNSGVQGGVKAQEEAPFRIEQLFGSRTRARLLGLFLEHAERAFYVRELARRIDAQLNSVRRELKNLVDIGIVHEATSQGTPVVEKDDEGKQENRRYYQANLTFPLFDDLRAVMKKIAVLLNNTLLSQLKHLGELDLLILTGRFTDTPGVLTDVLIVGELSEQGVQKAVTDFEHEIGREVNYTFMPRAEFEYRRDVGDRFLAGILSGKRVVLHDTFAKV